MIDVSAMKLGGEDFPGSQCMHRLQKRHRIRPSGDGQQEFRRRADKLMDLQKVGYLLLEFRRHSIAQRKTGLMSDQARDYVTE